MRVFVLLCVLFAVACGGGDDDTGTQDVPSGTTAVPAATATSRPIPTPEPTCSTDDGEAVAGLFEEFAQEWDDAMALAQSTPRMQLAGQIEDLQSIRRTVQGQEWPECAEDANGYLVDAMNAAIDGFIAFLSDDPQREIDAHFADYEAALESFADEVATLR